jgi:hypothetical protein
MALFPCIVGNHKYAGPQQSAYLAALNGTFAARSKQRLCPQHLDELGAYLENKLVLIARDNTMVSETVMDLDHCYQCPSQDTPWQLFANVFRRGQPQLDYYAKSCTSHLEEFRTTARLEL